MSISPAASPANGYLAIAHALRTEIMRGELGPNQQLPALSDLAARHRTTAITARRALRLLEGEGLVRVEHGVGSFVADWTRSYDLLHLPSFSAEMAAQELQSETQVRGRDLQARSAPAAVALREAPDAPLAMLARLRRVAGEPVVFQRSYVIGALRGVVETYTADRSLYEMLREHAGRIPVSAEEQLRAVPLPRDAALALESEPGAAGWLAIRTTYDAAGAPLVHDHACFAGERVELRIQRRAGQARLEYGLLPPAAKSE